jgi:hypothetical protein
MVTIDNAHDDCPRCPQPDEPGYWAPFCDFCDDGSNGCLGCNYHTTPNHNHDRWVIIDREQRAAEMRRFTELGIVPW